jgi:hypothetical protein
MKKKYDLFHYFPFSRTLFHYFLVLYLLDSNFGVGPICIALMNVITL